MIDISVKDLKKAYSDGVDILAGLSFDVQEGKHVGILGKNGGGKTTLFRLLTGEIQKDAGEIFIARGKRLGVVSQIPVYPPEYTAEDVLKTAHERVRSIGRRMAELERAMSAGDESVLGEYDRLSADFQRLGGYDTDFERARVANGLEINEEMRAQRFDRLSGGEKTRVNLARLILEDTDILLLDEPTNHLDLRAVQWLEDYILHFRGTVLAISHDRWFLDRTAQRIIEIKDGKADFYAGNYSFFVTERQRRFEEQLRIYEKNQAKIDQLTKAAQDMHLWAFMGSDKLHKRAFSMEKRIEKLQTVEKPRTERQLKARFASGEFSGDEVLVLEDVSKSYGGRELFSGVDLLVEGGERIALIGDNGAGKTTLLRLIMGEEHPDGGRIYRGPSVHVSYLPQIIRFDVPSRSLYDTMLWSEKCSPQEARDRLAAFSFRGEDVFRPVGALSGGEQSRLRLCMLMRRETNFLILDEPTNHLDIASREWIEDAVSDYDQALLFVSHDRWFIEKFATRIWYLSGGKITDFRGSFTEFSDWQSRRAAVRAAERSRPKQEAAAPPPKKPNAKAREKQLAKLERAIEKTETALAELGERESEAASDYKKLLELAAEREALEAECEELYRQWEALSE